MSTEIEKKIDKEFEAWLIKGLRWEGVEIGAVSAAFKAAALPREEKIAQLERELLSTREKCVDLESDTRRDNMNYEQQFRNFESQLERAEKVIEFYADKTSWTSRENCRVCIRITSEDWEDSDNELGEYGGLRAREYLKEKEG